MEVYSYPSEYGPNKIETNGTLLMLTHALYGSKKDLFVRITPSKPKTFVLTLKKLFIIPLKPLYIGKGRVCMRILCDFIFVDNIILDASNH